MDQSKAPLLLEEVLFKHTVIGDYVVQRTVRLYNDGFVTLEDPIRKPDDFRVFPLQHTATLMPANKEHIQRRKRHIRPKGVYSLTALAALRGKGQPVELYTFKLEMEGAWDFRFCFETLEQAQRWHSQLSAVIEGLQAEEGVLHKPSSKAAPAAKGQGNDRDSDAAGSARSSYGDGSNARTMLQGSTFTHGPMLHAGSSCTEEDVDADLAQLLNVQPGTARRRLQQRWVPYTHSNGLAIYQHQSSDSSSGSGKGGEEYMVSAVIRGAPGDVLRALLDPGSATTILGPALEVEVLESTPGRQVMRIQVQALGKTAAWFRPREAVVQRLLKKEDDGVYVVLFSSVDTYDARNSWAHEGVIEEAEGLGGAARLSNPIRCRVSGGYTISKLQGFRGSDSPESLLTCILQVNDMGGWLNRSHPLFRVVDWWSGGAYEAFLQRMLLGVMLVRDVVENSRFAVKQPAFSFQEAQQEGEEEEEAEAEAGTEPAQDLQGKAISNLRTSTFVMRQAAAAVGFTSPFASAAGQPPISSLPSFRPASSVGALSTKQRGVLVRPSRLASLRLPGSGPLSSQPLASVMAPTSESTLEEPQPEFKLPRKYYEEIHTAGRDAPFNVRGPTYLSDGRKVAAGPPVFELLGMEVVDVGGPVPCPHVSRFLPSVRRSSKPFLFVYNLMVPGPPTMCCVFVFGSDSHPSQLGHPPDDPEESSSWTPFDYLLYRFLQGDDEERRSLFKMIPRIAEGSWVIKQSVGTTPVIIGRKLATSFHITQKYVEVAVDVGSSSTAQYITGMVRGGCRNLVLDLGLVLQGHHSWELPEELLGAVRVIRLDLAAASQLDDSKEVPLRIISTEQPAESAESTAG